MSALPEPFEFRPATPGTTASVFECGLCGFAFTHGEQACGSCLLGNGCLLVRCPRCGFQFPRESRTASGLRRLLDRLRGRR